MPSTLAAQEPRAQLEQAVSNMATADPKIRFAGKYFLTAETVSGSQGYVVIAADRYSHMFAIKCVLATCLFATNMQQRAL